MPDTATGLALRRLAAWAAAGTAVLLCGFATAGAIVSVPTFDPTELSVPPAVVALLALTAACFAAVGALIAARVGSVIGWLLLGIGCCISVTLAGMAIVARELPAARWGEWVQQWVSLVSFVLMVYLLLLFPNGQLPSSRWRPAWWLAHLTAAVILVMPIVPYSTGDAHLANPIGIHGLGGTILSNNQAGFALLPFATVLAGASAFARYRRADDVTRQQLKWFALAGTAVALGYLVQNAAWFSERWTSRTVAGAGLVVLIVTFAAVPIACGFAILRYRLYDVDRIISRSAGYLLVTGVVVAVYVAVVSIATLILPESSQVDVAAATLTAAAVINPLRHRVQAAVDRRFNRTHYDAVRLVDEFAAQLREAVSVDAVSSRLTAATAAALQPASVSVWTVSEPRQPGGL